MLTYLLFKKPLPLESLYIFIEINAGENKEFLKSGELILNWIEIWKFLQSEKEKRFSWFQS